MKLTKSKQFLADAIHASGKGWLGRATCATQDKIDPRVGFWSAPPAREGDQWKGSGWMGTANAIPCDTLSPNWHQTILSREEYFFLYQEQGLEDALNEDFPDSDGWIEWKGGECPVEKGTLVDVIWRNGTERAGVKALHIGGAGHKFWVADGMVNDIIAYRLHKSEQEKPEFCESVVQSIPGLGINSKNISININITQVDDIDVVEPKPTIEQLAADYRNAKDYADRKQQEADAEKADAEAKLADLVAAGKALGLVLSVAGPEPELVITDWRDLLVGDEVALTSPNGGGVNVGEVGEIMRIDDRTMSVNFPSQAGHLISRAIENWRFIRRP